VRIVIVAPAPLGKAESPQVEDEVDRVVAAWRNVRFQATVELVVPASSAGIAGTSAEVIHIAAHANEQGLLLEDAVGLATPTDVGVVADAIASAPPVLIVLNGCDTERMARRLHAMNGGTWLIGHEGFLGNAVAALFAEQLADRLATGTEIGAAFEAAEASVAARFGDSGYVLFPGNRKLPGRVHGKCQVQGFEAYESRIRYARAADVFHPVLIAGSRYCLSGSSSAFNVHGIPGAGVTTMLHAIAGRMAFAFERTLYKRGSEAVQAIDDVLAAQGKTLISIDEADSQFETETSDLMPRVRAACRSGMVRVILGTRCRLQDDGVTTAPPLPPLTKHDTRQILADSLPDEYVEDLLATLFDYVPVHAGMAMSAAAQVRANVPLQNVRFLLERGQEDERWTQLVARWQADPSMRLLLRAICLSGGLVRLEALKNAFTHAAAYSLRPGRSPDAAFSNTYALLRSNGIVDEIDAPNESTSAMVASTADLRLAIARIWMRPSASETAELLTGLIACAEQMRTEATLLPNTDIRWVSTVIKKATDSSMYDAVVRVGGSLIDRKSDFRRSGDRGAVLKLATAVLEAAEHQRDWQVAAQAALVSGEGSYGTGDLLTASSFFRKCLTFPADNEEAAAGDRLRAHRALGQVHYRQGEFLLALQEYEAAEKYESASPRSFGATLREHHAKALFRLGRLTEAETKLCLVLKFREEQDDLHALAKTQHELGRVLAASDRTDEAKVLFNLALVSAVASDFDRFLPAPLYELFLLSFEAEDQNAYTLASRCSAAAEDSGEELWLALSAVARGMIAFRDGSYREAGELFRQALSKADANGLGAARDDVRRFVARSVHGGPAKEMEINPTSAATLVAATWGLSEEKAAKALQYAAEPTRIQSADILFESKSTIRHLRWSAHHWSCDCALYHAEGICSHVVALSLYRTNPFGVVGEPESKPS
jgi:tetratricopeptide (TPR) repeat protein